MDHMTTWPKVSGRKLLTFTYNTGDNVMFYQDVSFSVFTFFKFQIFTICYGFVLTNMGLNGSKYFKLLLLQFLSDLSQTLNIKLYLTFFGDRKKWDFEIFVNIRQCMYGTENFKTP